MNNTLVVVGCSTSDVEKNSVEDAEAVIEAVVKAIGNGTRVITVNMDDGTDARNRHVGVDKRIATAVRTKLESIVNNVETDEAIEKLNDIGMVGYTYIGGKLELNEDTSISKMSAILVELQEDAVFDAVTLIKDDACEMLQELTGFISEMSQGRATPDVYEVAGLSELAFDCMCMMKIAGYNVTLHKTVSNDKVEKWVKSWA